MSSVEKVIDDTTEYVADAAIGVKAASRQEMSSVEKVIDDTTEYVADAAIGVKAATRGFQIRLDTSKVCKVNVLTRGAGKPTPVFRLDAAHGGHPGASVPHINIGSKISGIRDPHLPIPGGQVGLQVSNLDCCKLLECWCM